MACIDCMNTLAKLTAIVKAEDERRAREEHGKRIAARAAANRPWTPEEMDTPTLARALAAPIPGEPDEDTE